MTLTDETSTKLDVDGLVDQLLRELPPASTDVVTFLREQYDRGLAWVHFPPDCGGLGGTPADQVRAQRRLLAGGAPNAQYRNVIGYGMVAPTIVIHGTDRQKERYLRPLFTGEEVWCQLFSEPGAGSDPAGLGDSRAFRDGDEWVVNGQKVWTTLAHLSRFGLLLARTDPDVPKHAGLTMFLVDMHGPGVEVRPLYQITGEAEFNECFFTDARIPEADRLDAVGEGWHVALTTLMNERVSIGGNRRRAARGAIGEAVRLYSERFAGRHGPALAGAARRGPAVLGPQRGAPAHEPARSRTHDGAGRRARRAPSRSSPSPRRTSASTTCASTSWAPTGMLYSGTSRWCARRTARSARWTCTRPSCEPVRTPSRAGTSEVMRNILGERVLGLPGDVRVDKGIPWKDVPRS